MKLIFCLGLLAAAFAAQPWDSRSERFTTSEKSFRSGKEYTFHFDGQVASGLPVPASQQSSTRMNAIVSIGFKTEQTALFKISKIRVASGHRELPEPREVQPFSAFQEMELTKEQKEQLALPLRFRYENGVVSDLEFESREQPWSANIKRAILNMLQLDLTKKSRSDLHELSQNIREQNERTEKNTEFYNTIETNLEGECEASYTVIDMKEEKEVRVSKSINFEKCKNRVDIRYNFRFGEECPACEKKYWGQEKNTESSTVTNYKLNGNPKEFLVKEVELKSQYIFAPLNKDQEMMTTYVSNKLQLVQITDSHKNVEEPRNTEQKETLIYNPKWEQAVEKFQMTGESRHIEESSFEFMKKKVEIAREILDELERELSDEKNGVQIGSTHQVSRLVSVLRMSTHKEIKQLHEKVSGNDKLEHIFYDALAVAGTKSSIQYLVEKIISREINPIHASALIKMVVQTRTPSQEIVEELIKLAEHSVSEKNPVLKQSTWLTVGAIMNGVCGEQRDRLALQSGVPEEYQKKEDVCPREVKERYVKELEQLYKKSSTRYEKILALKTMGNSGMDLIVRPLEEIISDRRQEKTLRYKAIDSLRQLRSFMPRKIQSLLMPLFKNQNEHPEIRVNAFHQIMQTLPERNVIDQITQQLQNERSRQVHSFVYSALLKLSESEIACERDMAENIKTSLKLARVQPRKMFDSRYGNYNFYSNEFFSGASLNWAALFTNDSVLPKEMMASIDTLLGGQWNKYLGQVGIYQQNIDQVLYKLLDQIENGELNEVVVRGKRAATIKPSEMLKQLMQKLNIKHRRGVEEDPHAVLYLRYKDLDYALLPIDEETVPALFKESIRSGKIDITEIEKVLAQGYRFNIRGSGLFFETLRMIPTTLGMPLEVINKMPVVYRLEGEIKVELNPKSGKNVKGIKMVVKAQPSVAVTHVSLMEVRSPIVSIGSKLVHSAQLNLPIDSTIEINWEKNDLEVKTNIKAPEQKKRIAQVQTRPVTYIRHESNPQKLRSSVEKTIFISELPMVNYERTFGEDLLGVRMTVYGNVHRHLLYGSYERSPMPLFTSENDVEIIMEKGEQSPREYEISMTVNVFDKDSRMDKPKFNKYFDNDERVFDLEESEYRKINEESRRQSFNKYANEYKIESAYKHQINLVALTRGAGKERKGEMEIRTSCDEDLTFCKWIVKASRTPLSHESRKWELTADVQTIFPEPVTSMKQLREQKHREIQATVEAKWGSEEKNTLNVKIQAEQSREQQKWQQLVEEKKRESVKELEQVALASRLNQIKVVADYDMSPYTLVQLNRVRSLIQSYQPWNMELEPMMSSSKIAKEGRLVAKLTVEPQTWRYANVSVQTPSETFTLRDLYLPLRPTLLSIEKTESIRGFEELGRRLQGSSRSTCSVTASDESTKVSTFDEVVYRVPMTTCYSVLAKDCSSEQPRFAVLMKKMRKEGEESKIKIVSEDNVIEIENKNDELIVKVDGKVVKKESDMEKYGLEKLSGSHYKYESSEVTVRFNGVEAEIRLSELYKNQQCGICGHYDGESDNEFRRADNEETEDLESFHRSYLSRDDECQIEEDRVSKKENYKVLSDRQSEESEESYEYYGNNREEELSSSEEDDEGRSVEPIQKTHVIEYSHSICFSREAVPACPRKTHESRETKEMKVRLSCLSRSEPAARRLLRESARKVVDVEDLPESRVETIFVPKSCLVY